MFSRVGTPFLYVLCFDRQQQFITTVLFKFSRLLPRSPIYACYISTKQTLALFDTHLLRDDTAGRTGESASQLAFFDGNQNSIVVDAWLHSHSQSKVNAGMISYCLA